PSEVWQSRIELIFEKFEEQTGRPFPKSPRDSLIACIEAVFHSWNSERAVAYRAQHQIQDIKGTAVNVQAMFPSQVSGVVFTVNPNNLEAEEMVIESSFGLGESVVSGEVDPDRFAICRQSKQILRSEIGAKHQVISALGSAGPPSSDAASLDQTQLIELADMSMKIEELFGKPVDIEFGWSDNEFGLLQARPIRGIYVAQDV
ncbi:MAG: PEP/pyruvate-binding domain-containing protein, partial [Planctomycetota bacterium]|nr:PEP/pyruvate-binding domain-containing protein [Planctomycetota bacterium]